LPGERSADTGHRFDIGKARTGHRAGGAEMRQQRALAAGTDAGDLVQRIGADRLGALFPVAANGETVRFVTKALKVIEHRTLGIEAESLFAGHVEMLAAGIAVRSL